MIIIEIQPGDELPIYRQIMRQFTEAVAGGRLSPGGKLPSQRELAEQLVISHLTVKKAYEELEREGILETRRGRGTFVSETAGTEDSSARLERLRPICRRLASQAWLGGVPFERVVKLLHEEREELAAGRERKEDNK
ncbi:MAG: GntR family transcriptional regulator [bacterium]|nr:GntR family transcriptional regulator [bacterium]